MLTVEDYGQIRRAHHDGMSIRVMARVFHRSRQKIRVALARPQPQGYTRTKDPPAPKLDPFADHRRHPQGRRTGSAQAAAHRDAALPAAAGEQGTSAGTPRSVAPSEARRDRRDVHPAGPRSRKWRMRLRTSAVDFPGAVGRWRP